MIKPQALADFIAKFTIPDDKEIQTNGLSAQKREGVWVIINTPEGDVLKYGVQL